MALKEEIIEGIEVFSDTSIRIYRYGNGFNLPIAYAQAIKSVHSNAIDSIAKHFAKEQIQAWKASNHNGFIDLVRQCHATYIVFDGKEEIIGYAILSVSGFLKHLYIHPKSQKRGFGTRLLNQIEDDLSNYEGETRLSLKGNHASYGFYQKYGYVTGKTETILMQGIELPVIEMYKLLG